MNAFIEGSVAGLALAVSFGPGFVALMQSSVNHGFRNGMMMLAGIAGGDMLLIGAGYLGFAPLLKTIGESRAGLAIGAIVLIIFGITSFFGKPKADQPAITTKKEIVKSKLKWSLIGRGLILNLSNPLNFIFWLGVLVIAGNNFGTGSPGFFSFFGGLLTVSVGSDLLKCALSDRLRLILKPSVINLIGKIAGVIFIAAGIYLAIRIIS